MLSAELSLADGEGTVLTGTISLTSQPWLADHTIRHTPIVPGTAFLDLALHAARRHATNAPHVRELTLHAPLSLTHRPTEIQLTVRGSSLTIHARAAQDPDAAWTHHVTAVLSAETPAQNHAPAHASSPATGAVWPPPDAVPLDGDGFYEVLADSGYQYGPTFQGLTDAWYDADDPSHLYANVSLDADTSVTGHSLHPALLDAALHVLKLSPDESAQGPVKVPYSLHGVTHHAPSTEPTTLRVHLTRTGETTLALTATDADGAPVITVDTLALLPVTSADPLLHVRWVPVSSTSSAHAEESALPSGPVDLTDLDGDSDSDSALPGQVHALTRRTLALLQSRLFGGEETEETEGVRETEDAEAPLVLVTRHALAVRPGEEPDLAQAAVVGLIRTAQSEHPGRVLHMDLDAAAPLPASAPVSPAEPQVAYRDGICYVPRLVSTPVPKSAPTFTPDGTVLITGGTGALGALTARHLITEHGARHLLLISRSGPHAPGADTLHTQLTNLGAHITIKACDTTDPHALTTLLDTIPTPHPLTAVIHTAGVVDDATLTSLTAEQVEAVLRPKVDAAWNLHQLTQDKNLDAFVLYSSLAGTIGSPGQANYAAANTFLDTLAHHRHTTGLPATSLAWGPWAAENSMTGRTMTEADFARITRTGFPPLATEDGLALLDAALAADGVPVLATARLDSAALRAQARAGTLPALLTDLVPRAAVTADGTSAPSVVEDEADALVAELAPLDASARLERMLLLVRATSARVLAFGGPDEVESHLGFLDMGFDSLATVQLRNQLGASTGLQLPTTLAFDYPTPKALAQHLLAELPVAEAAQGTPAQGTAPGSPANEAPSGGDVLGELNRLEAALSAASFENGENGPTRGRVREKLQELLWKLESTHAENGVRDQLMSGTTGDVLDFIDREFSDALPFDVSSEANSDGE